MKIAFPLLLILISSSGCRPVTNKPIFESISISYNDGGTHSFSMKIDSSTFVRKCDYKIVSRIESAQCYCDTLSQHSIDSINYFMKRLRANKPAPVYEDKKNCQDCSWYIIQVKEGGTRTETKVIDPGKKNNSFLIDSLVQFIVKRSYLMTKVDTIYTFEFDKRLVPPSLPHTAN